MKADNQRYLACGTLRVKASGYWYTSGGAKGSFGYYPHLKDLHGLPVYPDTQIHGDLLMAHKWLNKLGTDFDSRLCRRVFGREGRSTASCLYITDLTLSKESQKNFNGKRFEIKPRIEIDDRTRTVKDKMLAYAECAYLEGLDLNADIYLGYFDSAGERDEAQKLLEECMQLLSGFGAYRSRGYGRGKLSIAWHNPQTVQFEGIRTSNTGPAFTYLLEALVHFRNKPVEPGRAQQLDTLPLIRSDQLRAWFIRTFKKLFDTWPSLEELSTIRFPNCYPSFTSNDRPCVGYPPPMTMLKNENGEIQDISNRTGEYDDSLELENFFKVKPKPLGQKSFVTNAVEPKVVDVQIEERFRNSIDERFVTLETGGLFVQAFIHKGTLFGGGVNIAEPESDFGTKALFIFRNCYPTINGTIFKPQIVSDSNRTGKDQAPYLVTEPIVFDPETFSDKHAAFQKIGRGILRPQANQIMLGSVKRFNTTLKRPRRNQIAVLPGSLLMTSYGSKQMSWTGAGSKASSISELFEAQGRPDHSGTPTTTKVSLGDLKEEAIAKITRAQMGALRAFLNPNLSLEAIITNIENRLDKYKKWGTDKIGEHLLPAKLLGQLLDHAQSGKRDNFNAYIIEIKRRHALVRWNEMRKEVADKYQKEWEQEGNE